MKRVIFVLFTAVLFVTAMAFAASAAQTFTGTITDSMCVANHAMMHISPDAKCVRQCAKTGGTVKYALFDGKSVYRLSDQLTPAEFAGQQVKVTGTLFTKTGIIQLEKIERVK
jgi:type 1 fimbria pilin